MTDLFIQGLDKEDIKKLLKVLIEIGLVSIPEDVFQKERDKLSLVVDNSKELDAKDNEGDDIA